MKISFAKYPKFVWRYSRIIAKYPRISDNLLVKSHWWWIIEVLCYNCLF